MKLHKRTSLITALLFFITGVLIAQISDYEIIQNFKKTYQTVYDSVRSANNLEKCDLLEQKIEELKAESSANEALLNEGLHPDNFESVFTKIYSQLAIAKEKNKLSVDLSSTTQQNDSLRQEVTSLNSKVQLLSDENSGMLKEVKALKQEIKKDKESMARMSQLIDKLKANIEARDNLVINMLDSLYNEFARPDLNDVEKGNLQLTINNKDFLRTILNTVEDNEKFIETASLTAQDIMFIKEEQKKFAVLWKKISPSIGQLYPDETTRMRSISMVDDKILSWKRKIGNVVWKNIYLAFTKQNVNVPQFNNAVEFHDNLITYIDTELKNLDKEKFISFNDSVWEPVIKEQWMTVIQSDNSLTEQQRIEIEQKIDLWAKNFSSGYIKWIVIGFVLLIALIAVIFVMKKIKHNDDEPSKI